VDSATQKKLRLSGVYKDLPSVFLYDVLLKNRDIFLNDKTKEQEYTFQDQRYVGSWFVSVIVHSLSADILKIEITYTFGSFKDIHLSQYSLFLHDSIIGLE
jgi:hypothetical protein